MVREGCDMTEAELLRLARLGATARYVDLLKELGAIRKAFPGVDRAAKAVLLRPNLERAWSARRRKQR